ncbi:MAG: CehA/McbA family metallohydrolase, partial [Planctomycetes bacterium]|nr:CehA/McbA family metallohydrolase [Planctomycetota bacterium]
MAISHLRGLLVVCSLLFCLMPACCNRALAEVPTANSVEGQPLAANAIRLLQALDFLGTPLPEETVKAVRDAARRRDAKRLQELLDPNVLFVVSLNPEVRVKVKRGPAKPTLQQGGFTPHLVKVLNSSTVTRQLRVSSPQSGPVYSGASLAILRRQAQTELNENENTQGATDRFLETEMFQAPPMTHKLSGLEVEYAIVLIYSSEAGKREATIGFDVGAGTQDIGFRGEVPILFDIRPAIPVKLSIKDNDGTPTTARLTFRDQRGRVYPSQAKRLAPDFFFQPQIYRKDGDIVLLPPGKFTLESCRGPEYKFVKQNVVVTKGKSARVPIKLERWINPMDFGFYCGDHHIHGAGCSHYESPTKGVSPQDMFSQVKGEGLNVGCVLTWGPCFEFQRQFFSPTADKISEPLTVLKYDLEISGFGSAALGHVCLLNLKDQTYPGSNGTKQKGWPTWTVPVMRWCKEQGGVTGYPHSAMHVNPPAAAKRFLNALDKNSDGLLTADEAAKGLLPEAFARIDADGNNALTERELTQSIDRVADQLPNLAVPEMNGAGAMEICVSAVEGVCDFISAMDTARIPEWNTWYHLLNCGFPIKLSGETDFPCMSSRRVGQGRVYVQLGEIEKLDFATWCRNLAKGRSYVSDGYAHAVSFTVNGRVPGEDNVMLDGPGP